MNLLDLLDAHIFTGVAGNAAFSLIRAAWQKANNKSWEDLYLDAFQAALREAEPYLARHAKEDGDIALNRQSLSDVLHYDLALSVDALDYSQLSDKAFTEKLAKVMEDHSLLVIGGHQLSQADYSHLIRNLVRAATTLFKAAVVTHEPAFRHEVVNGLLQQQELTRQVQDFLTKQFGPQVLADLSDIKDTLDDMASSLHQIQTTLPGSISHPLHEIPTAPAPYIAHPYDLLQTPTLIGRQDELNLLTAWTSKPETDIYQAHILSIIALGGMGKSALTWTWFQDIAPRVIPQLEGRLWWSFYVPGAAFEAFVLHALAYVSKRDKQEVQKLSLWEQESLLFSILDNEPYLLVLDGLERLLQAYTPSRNASHFPDETLDEPTANAAVKAPGAPMSAIISFTGRHWLRKTVDVRTGTFLRRLSKVRASRLLLSSRLYPADLQTETGEPLSGCQVLVLHGLADVDALRMWRTLGLEGSRESVLPLLYTFEKHPLLIQILAGVIARDRKTPGDLKRWRVNHPHFNPFQLPLIQVQSHILTVALQGLDEQAWQTLSTLSSFHMPVPYETLTVLMVGKGRYFRREEDLIVALEDLEGRGLLGWNSSPLINRYDMHPVVRGVVWSRLDEAARYEIYERRFKYLDDRLTEGEQDVTTLEDLASDIEYFYTLVGIGDLSEALFKLRTYLFDVLVYRLRAFWQLAELVEVLFFPDGIDQAPLEIMRPTNLERPLEDLYERSRFQTWALNALAMAYKEMGQLEQAVRFFSRALDHSIEMGDGENEVAVGFNLSATMYLCGQLYGAENAARKVLHIAQKRHDPLESSRRRRYLARLSQAEILSLQNLNEIWTTRGLSVIEIQQALILVQEDNLNEAGLFLSLTKNVLAECSLQLNDLVRAEQFATEACEIGQSEEDALILTRARRIQGTIALRQGNLERAVKLLNGILTSARVLNDVREELYILIGLAELHRQRGDLQAARELLDDVREIADRGPYRLAYADACNVLAQIERDAGNRAGAIEAANLAYRHAWCDGPPFAYHWGLQTAKAHLAALGEPEPNLPPFDESKYQPLSDIEINSLD